LVDEEYSSPAVDIASTAAPEAVYIITFVDDEESDEDVGD
jgi:hypothetical protein